MTVPILNAKIASVNSRVLRSARAALTSPYTLTTHAQNWGGQRWEYDITVSAAQGVDGKALSAFFNALGGTDGTFLFADPSMQQSVGGAPLVRGGGQTGNSLEVDGLPAGVVSFRAGDFFSLGVGASTRLYQVLSDIVADGSGYAVLPIVPALRSSPADNAALEAVAPKVLLRSFGDVPSAVEPAMIFRFSFTAYEAI